VFAVAADLFDKKYTFFFLPRLSGRDLKYLREAVRESDQEIPGVHTMGSQTHANVAFSEPNTFYAIVQTNWMGREHRQLPKGIYKQNSLQNKICADTFTN
jgi:5-bromo-4-chloroindolyl phosphate hydrolysis protein